MVVLWQIAVQKRAKICEILAHFRAEPIKTTEIFLRSQRQQKANLENATKARGNTEHMMPNENPQLQLKQRSLHVLTATICSESSLLWY